MLKKVPMLKRVLLMSAVLLALAYPKRPVVVSMDDPIPECPPFCDQVR
jgi:hypothetical protein